MNKGWNSNSPLKALTYFQSRYEDLLLRACINIKLSVYHLEKCYYLENEIVGFAGIKVGNKWGVINSAGEIVQEPIYELQGISPNFIGKYYSCLQLIMPTCNFCAGV